MVSHQSFLTAQWDSSGVGEIALAQPACETVLTLPSCQVSCGIWAVKVVNLQ